MAPSGLVAADIQTSSLGKESNVVAQRLANVVALVGWVVITVVWKRGGVFVVVQLDGTLNLQITSLWHGVGNEWVAGGIVGSLIVTTTEHCTVGTPSHTILHRITVPFEELLWVSLFPCAANSFAKFQWTVGAIVGPNAHRSVEGHPEISFNVVVAGIANGEKQLAEKQAIGKSIHSVNTDS